MPVKTKTFSTYGRKGGASKWMHAIVDVDASGVMEVLDLIEEAVSPIGLMFFLNQQVSPYFEDQIVDTFADLGGGGVIGGAWAPLEASTLRIRHTLGYWDDYAINERSGELMKFVATTRTYSVDAVGANMQIPGNSGNPELTRKLRTAQEGYVQGPDDLIPGAVTPARPVLNLNVEDLMAVHAMLQIHIVNWVATGFLMGAP